MHKKLLESIIALTAERDIEALEYSLLSCLADMFSCVSLAIIKPVSNHGPGLVRETLRLWLDEVDGSHRSRRDGELMIPGPELLRAMSGKTVVESQNQSNQAVLYFPVADNETLLAMIVVTSIKSGAGIRTALGTLGRVYRNFHDLLSENSHDSLTGLLNRKTIDKNFTQLVASQRQQQRVLIEKHVHQQKRTLSECDQVFLAVADIDHFKHINDDYGHIYGDEILLLLTKVMRESFRGNDLLFRFGGEEFVVLLEPTDQEQAYKVLEKFRMRVEEFHFPRVLHVTISIGFTAVSDHDHLTQVVDRADKALYFAKEHGRNSTFYYDQLLQQGLMSETKCNGSVELF